MAMSMAINDSEFEQAAQYLRGIAGKLDSNDLLYFYARFKQVKEGPNNSPKPGFFNFQDKQKWQVWKDLKDLSKEDAELQYIEHLDKIEPDWREKEPIDPQKGWVCVSTLSSPNGKQQIDDNEKSICDWIQEGNADNVKKCLETEKIKLDTKDQNGMGLIHWAADRGQTNILKILLDHGFDMNLQDDEGQTVLHYASSCEYIDMIKFLCQRGANTELRDVENQTAIDVANEGECKDAFFSKS